MASGESPVQPLPDAFGSAEGFLDALARSAGAVVTFIDAFERVRFITHEAAAWLGMPPESILGKTLEELHEPASYEFFAPRLKRALAGERVQYERSVRHADGRSVWMSVSLSPHRDAQGNVVGVFSCSLEVNDLKRTHDALGRFAFDTPFEFKGAEVRCGASVGVSLYPDHARDPAALLASADQAMYREKAPRE